MRAGAGNAFILNNRLSFVMFKVTGEDRIEGQKVLASLIIRRSSRRPSTWSRDPFRPASMSPSTLSTSARSARMTI